MSSSPAGRYRAPNLPDGRVAAVQGAKVKMGLILTLGVAALALPAARAQIQPGDFLVDDGRIERAASGRLVVSTREMRATLKYPTEQNVTVNFTYLGPTKEVSRLGNGEVRSQFGIKLRAQDTCNIVYIMWHFAPDQRIAVSVKRNPGQRRHEECFDDGYINNVKPRVSRAPEPVHPDEPHSLTASMIGSLLTVTADGKVVWEGDLGPVALEFDGPVGLRSDNVHLVFDFLQASNQHAQTQFNK